MTDHPPRSTTPPLTISARSQAWSIVRHALHVAATKSRDQQRGYKTIEQEEAELDARAHETSEKVMNIALDLWLAFDHETD